MLEFRSQFNAELRTQCITNLVLEKRRMLLAMSKTGQRLYKEDEVNAYVDKFCDLDVSKMLPNDLLAYMRGLLDRLSSLVSLYDDSFGEKLMELTLRCNVSSMVLWVYKNYYTSSPASLEVVQKACECLLYFTFPEKSPFSKRYFEQESVDMFITKLQFPELIPCTLNLIKNLAIDLSQLMTQVCQSGIYSKIVQVYTAAMPEKLGPYIEFFHATIASVPASENLRSLLRQLYLSLADKCLGTFVNHFSDEQISRIIETIAMAWVKSGDNSLDLFKRPKFLQILKDFAVSFDEFKYSSAYKILVQYSAVSDCEGLDELIDPAVMALQLEASRLMTRRHIFVTANNMLLDKDVGTRWARAIQNHPTLYAALMDVTRKLAMEGCADFNQFLTCYSHKLNPEEFVEFVTQECVADILTIALSNPVYKIQKTALEVIEDFLWAAKQHFSAPRHEENIVVKVILQNQYLLEAFNKLGSSKNREVREAQESICCDHMPENY